METIDPVLYTPLRAVNILMRMGMGHTLVNTTPKFIVRKILHGLILMRVP